MKTLVVISVLICSSYTCLSQSLLLPEFAPIGAKWTTISADGTPPFISVSTGSYYSLSSNNINNIPCKKIGTPSHYFYAYRDSFKMYIHSSDTNANWKSLYDFSWPVGYIATIPVTTQLFAYGEDSMSYEVISKGDTIINGYTLPFLHLSNGQRQHYVIMNIGCTNSQFIIFRQPIQDAADYDFRCYEDTVIGNVKSPQVTSNCDTAYTTSINEIKKQELNLYPNPAQDYLKIETNQPGSMVITLSDITGKLLLQQPVNNGARIDITGIPSGLYLYQLIVEGLPRQTGKVVKQ